MVEVRLGFGHSRIRERSPNVEFECCSKSSIRCLTLDFIRMFESPHSKVEYSKPNVRECRIRMLKKSDFWIRITTLRNHADRPRTTPYDPNLWADSEFEVGFYVAHRNLELEDHLCQHDRPLTRGTDPVRPNGIKIHINHQILTLETQAWARTTTMGREKGPTVKFICVLSFKVAKFIFFCLSYK